MSAADGLHAFDALVGQVRQTVAGLGAGAVRTTRAMGCTGEEDGGAEPAADGHAELPALPFSAGPHAGRGIVLKSAAAVELGGVTGSCALVLTTADIDLVRDGRVTLVGPDFTEMAVSDGGCAESPFAQVILVAGPAMGPACQQAAEDCASVKDYIDGYFLRTAPGELTARISKRLLASGFSIAGLAGALTRLVKEEMPSATAVECLFVTSSHDDVAAVRSLYPAVAEVAHDLRKETWAERGIDIDCPSGGHCGACADKQTCDRVRAIERMHKRLEQEESDSASSPAEAGRP